MVRALTSRVVIILVALSHALAERPSVSKSDVSVADLSSAISEYVAQSRNQDVQVSFDAAEGRVFAGRFHLLEFLGRSDSPSSGIGQALEEQGMAIGQALLEFRGWSDSSSLGFGQALEERALGRAQHIPLPPKVKSLYRSTSELHAGSFGEAWTARDIATNQLVTLKVFYRTNPASGKKEHVNWSMAETNRRIAKMLRAAAYECVVARRMQSFADDDSVGASRFVQCYEDHVQTPISSTGHSVGQDDVVYQVLEHGGDLNLSQWLAQNQGLLKSSPERYHLTILSFFRQIIEGLSYLQNPKHSIKWVHHDLKPDNVVIRAGKRGGMPLLKFIDFGAVTESPGACLNTSATTPNYAPPEWLHKNGSGHGYDCNCPWSFDVYSAATILDLMVTGRKTFQKFSDEVPTPTAKIKRCIELKTKEAGGSLSVAQQTKVQKACHKSQWQRAVKIDQEGERAVTLKWGAGDNVLHASRKMRKQINKFFFATAKNNKDYVPVINMFRARLRKESFLGTFIRMFAFYAMQRPHPSRILKHRFVSSLPSPRDPHFKGGNAKRKLETVTPSNRPRSNHTTRDRIRSPLTSASVPLPEIDKSAGSRHVISLRGPVVFAMLSVQCLF